MQNSCRIHPATQMDIRKELAEIPYENEGKDLGDIYKEEEKETPAETPAEKKPEEEEETEEEKIAREAKETEEEEKIPFHKHPRFKALVDEKNQYKEELDKFKENMESKFSEIKESQSKTTNIPGWFTELYGENEAAWVKYQEYDKQTRDEIKQEIRDEFQKEQKEKDELSSKWNSWIDEQVDSLKEDGKKFEKNELIKVMMDYKPSDDKGNLDFKKGYEIMELLKKNPEKAEARKKLVDESGKSKSEPEAKKWFTPDDLKGKGW